MSTSGHLHSGSASRLYGWGVWLMLSVLWAKYAESAASATVDDSKFLEEGALAMPTTRDHIGRVVLPVRINGQGPFRFIVDTGASRSTISADLARTLGLEPQTESPINLDGITGAALVSYVWISRMQAGDLVVEGTRMPVVQASVMAGADGILGAAGIEGKSLVIDFRRNQVAIASHVDSGARAQAIRIHGARASDGLLIVNTTVAGIPVVAVLDTGSERTLGNAALRDALKARRHSGQGFVAQLTSVYGATSAVETGEIQSAPDIVLDSLRITNLSVVFGDFHIFKIWGMQAVPAMILGMDVLGTVAKLSLDFKNQYVYIAGAGEGRGMRLETPHELSDVQSQRK
jgi:hypothetical protein